MRFTKKKPFCLKIPPLQLSGGALKCEHLVPGPPQCPCPPHMTTTHLLPPHPVHFTKKTLLSLKTPTLHGASCHLAVRGLGARAPFGARAPPQCTRPPPVSGVCVAGVVRSVKDTLSSQFVEDCRGVVQRLTLQEHKMVWNRTTHLWYVPPPPFMGHPHPQERSPSGKPTQGGSVSASSLSIWLYPPGTTTRR